MSDAIMHPGHYTDGGVETWDAIASWDLDYFLGNAVKYISRAGKKGSESVDLQKAIQYIRKRVTMLSCLYLMPSKRKWTHFNEVHEYAAAKHLTPQVEMALQLLVLGSNRMCLEAQINALEQAVWFLERRIITIERSCNVQHG